MVEEKELEAPLKKILELSHAPDAYVDLSKVYNNQAITLMNSYKDTKNVADSLEAMKMYDKEIALLEEGYKLHPEDSAILAQLSNAYVEANKMDVAMETFKKGIEKDPTNEKYRYNYGVLLLGANQYADAVEQFKKAIEIKSDYPSAYYNLGVAYLKWGAELQEKAIQENSDDMTYKEKFKEALPALEKYLESNPKDAAIWNYVGKVYANLGDTEKSKEAFDKADEYSK
ncbi:MAG: tetratricopeptide repeat protein [Chlorobi bacterium]|nr:tetratricopeptide repeat protein [Chlorobiota bacterium]